MRADVLVEGKKIAAIGPDLKVAEAQIIDASRSILIPGFVDAHRHAWEGQIRGIIPNAASLADYAAATREAAKRAGGQGNAARPAKAKLSYKESRELAELPAKIEALEKEQAGIATGLADGSVYRDDPKRAQAMNERNAAIEKELVRALVRWEDLGAR